MPNFEFCATECMQRKSCTHYDFRNDTCALKSRQTVKRTDAVPVNVTELDLDPAICGILTRAENPATRESPPPPPREPSGSSNSKEIEKKQQADPTEQLWIWLGPVIGAVATVVGSLLAVLCVRKERHRRDQEEMYLKDEAC